VLTGREGRTPKCPRADKAVAGSNFRRGVGGRGGHKCPLASRAVVGSNVQKRGGHVNVQGQIRLSLRATLEREEGHECPLADRAVDGSNVQKRGGHMNVQGWKELPLRATFKGRTEGL
jgi:hypothetical protein